MQSKTRSESQSGLVAYAAAEGAVAFESSSAPIETFSIVANGAEHADELPFTVDEQVSPESRLLHPFDVLPTQSRILQGLRDLGMLMVMMVPYLVLRAARYIVSWLGITEHRWKGAIIRLPLSREEQQQLRDVIVMLRSGKIPDAVLRQAVTAVSSGADPSAKTRILTHLSAVTTALDQVASALDLNYDPAHQQAALCRMANVLDKFARRDAVDDLDVLKELRRTTKHFVRDMAQTSRPRPGALEKQALRSPVNAVNQFVFHLLMETSRAQPPLMRGTVLQLEDGSCLEEVCRLVPVDMGVAFLRTQGPRFNDQVHFMSRYQQLRPSDTKKEEVVQAMTINAREHLLYQRFKDGSVREVASVLRSGGFATHGRRPRRMGLAGLKEMEGYCQQAPLPMRQAVLSEAGFNSLDHLQEEVHMRRGCCIAQALPLVVKAIRDMCTRRSSLQSVVRSGRFLYVQHSLLSDLNPREGAYLQDLKGALDELTQRLQVRFVFKPESVFEVQGATIILYLERDLVTEAALPEGVTREELLSRVYAFTAAIFNCGVNILQSLGFLLPSASGHIVQDVCNRQALERLNDYARQAGLSSCPGLVALNQHYGPGGLRGAKDVDSIWLVRVATRDLGGSRAVNCKSGKDRTAMEIAISFTQEASEQLPLSPSQHSSLLEALQGGLSYLLTSQNNGRPCAYAFTEFELVTLPGGWAPAWKLCGKVQT